MPRRALRVEATAWIHRDRHRLPVPCIPVVVVFALLAALGTAVSSVLQAKAAENAPAHLSLRVGLLFHLLGRPVWIAGIAIGVVGFCFHALALDQGTLVEVEPILTTSLLFALPLGVRMGEQRLGVREWSGAGAMIVGLTGFLVLADPTGGDYEPSGAAWVVTGVVVGGVAGGCVLLGRRATSPATRAAFYGSAAGVLFAAGAAVTKAATAMLDTSGLEAVLTSWIPWAIAIGGLAALLLAQSAFQAGPLAPALTPFVGLNPLVAGLIGIALFGEQIHTQPSDVVGALVAVGVALGGIVTLARSPVVAAAERGAPASSGS